MNEVRLSRQPALLPRLSKESRFSQVTRRRRSMWCRLGFALDLPPRSPTKAAISPSNKKPQSRRRTQSGTLQVQSACASQTPKSLGPEMVRILSLVAEETFDPLLA